MLLLEIIFKLGFLFYLNLGISIFLSIIIFTDFIESINEYKFYIPNINNEVIKFYKGDIKSISKVSKNSFNFDEFDNYLRNFCSINEEPKIIRYSEIENFLQKNNFYLHDEIFLKKDLDLRKNLIGRVLYEKAINTGLFKFSSCDKIMNINKISDILNISFKDLKVNSKIFFFALNSNEVKLFFSNLGTSKKSNSAFMLTLLFKKSEVFN